MNDFAIRAEFADLIRWSTGSCGQAGCADPECACAICRKPIGVSEDDPQWADHPEWCGGCELCDDQVPIILFRGEGKAMLQAAFHTKCFTKAIEVRRSSSGSPAAASHPARPGPRIS
jgi:hypothetical protein